MGWSCSAAAADTMDRWSKACVKQTGSQNVYLENGERFFWEYERKEHESGAITGELWRFVSEDKAVPAGRFRIEGNGKVTKGPKL